MWLLVAYLFKYTPSILKRSKRMVKVLKKGPSILEGVLTMYVLDEVRWKYVLEGAY